MLAGVSSCYAALGSVHRSQRSPKLAPKIQLGPRFYSSVPVTRLPSRVLSKSDTSSPLIKTFLIERPAQFNYHAGQAVNIYVPTQGEFALSPATFSMISAPVPGNEHVLEIAVKSTNYAPIRWLLDKAKENETIMIDAQPLGEMHLPLLRTPTDPLVLIGGGIGITPILSIVEQLSSLKPTDPQPPRIDIFHQVANSVEFFSWRRLINFASLQSRANLSLLISDMPSKAQLLDLPPEIQPFTSFGVVNHRILQDLNLSQRHNFVVCGPPGFVDATRNTLVDRLGIHSDRIFVN